MILVTGSLAYDTIMDFPGTFSEHIMPEKIHMLNVSFLVDKMRKGFGGTAGNIAYTLSLLGINCAILGLVGEDFKPYKSFLHKNEINITYIKTINNLFTSTAYGITDKGDNQIWGFYTGADSLSENLSVSEVAEKIDFGIIAPHNPAAMLKFAHEYQQKKISYLFDPGMQLPYFRGSELKEAFNGAKIIIGNDYEVSVMEKKTGISNLGSLALHDKIIITTLGDKGSIVQSKDGKVNIKPALVSNTSDPAGAGDAFRGGFIAGYIRGLPLETCAQMGSVAAAYTVEKYGTTTHNYTISEFRTRYKDNYSENLLL